MKSHALSKGAAVLFLALFTLSAADARAEDEAVVRFERGVQLYEAENFEAALVEFSTAYKLSRNYKLLYNIAICQMATKDYATAADSFRQYLNEGGAEVAEARRKEVQDRLAKLSLMVARVNVVSNAPAGTVLTIDDRPVGKLPLSEPLTVKTGRRLFSVTVAGRNVVKTVDVASGEVTTIDLSADEAPGPTAPPPPAPLPPEQPSSPGFPWALWAVTGVLGGGAAVTGVLAVGARNELGEERARYQPSRSTIDDQQSKAKTLGLVTDGLLIGTVLAAGLSTYFTVRWATAKPALRGSTPAPHAGLTITPMGMHFTRSF